MLDETQKQGKGKETVSDVTLEERIAELEKRVAELEQGRVYLSATDPQDIARRATERPVVWAQPQTDD